MYRKIFKIAGILLLGALGALIFNFFIMPYMITNTYFDKFQFIKDFKNGKIIINQKESIYIQENLAISDAVQRVKKSIVAIQSAALGLRGGFIITSDGLLVTLADAIQSNNKTSVFLAGEPVDFKVVKTDYKNNLALLKIDKNDLQTVGFADANKIKLGQKVFLVAATSKKQDNWLANEGIIREIDTDPSTDLIQIIKTNISEKSIVKGSPLFDLTGQLIGLNFIDSDNRVSVIPMNKIKSLLGL